MTIENLLIKNVNIVGTIPNIAVIASETSYGGASNILFRKVGIVGSVTTTNNDSTCYPASFISDIGTDGAGTNTTRFENCYARVDLTKNGDGSGGIYGGFGAEGTSRASATATNCYWSGVCKGKYLNSCFAFFYNSLLKTSVQNCYYDKQKLTNAQTNNGTGLTTAQMQTQASYVGWDFENTWYMGADGYPELKFEK